MIRVFAAARARAMISSTIPSITRLSGRARSRTTAVRYSLGIQRAEARRGGVVRIQRMKSISCEADIFSVDRYRKILYIL